jgi:hypothetical protein
MGPGVVTGENCHRAVCRSTLPTRASQDAQHAVCWSTASISTGLSTVGRNADDHSF